MENETNKAVKNPTPEERPDLYDYYDGGGLFRETGVKTPDYIQKLIDERKGKAPAPDKNEIRS